MHENDAELQADYLDWFFLSYFGKGQGYWRNLTDDKIQSIITLQNEKEQTYWKNWAKMFKQMFSK